MVVKHKYSFMPREKMFFIRVGKTIRANRDRVGISQKALGKRLGFSVNDTRVSLWENAKREICLYDYLRVARVLGFDPWSEKVLEKNV